MQYKIIEIHGIVNMHEANLMDTYFLMLNRFNVILMPHPQMPSG